MRERKIDAIGIDVAESCKGLDLVALDATRSIIESKGRLTPEDVARVVASLRPKVVCVDSPVGWASSGKSRLAERQLAAVGIQSYRTGPDPGEHPFYAWVRVGLRIYENLANRYPRYRGGTVAGHAAEVFPNATAVLLAGGLPGGNAKIAFRRQVLRDHGVAEQDLPTLDRVDATLAALTGLVGLEGGHSSVGDPTEGVILLPVRRLARMRLSSAVSCDAANARSVRSSRSAHPNGATVQIGYVNRNNQQVIAATGLPGTDHGQSVYLLRCGYCDHEYGSNGSNNFQRKCPQCQGGATGPPYIRHLT